MEVLWQYIVVLILLVLAVGYLLNYFIRRRRRKPSCADCPLCDTERPHSVTSTEDKDNKPESES
ncbi:MAG: hypothetical protein U9N55_09530 [candidate division Zixibacteria bacterium]|nr:hypothetical protein [candidate division Zixibacteria bacterium]